MAEPESVKRDREVFSLEGVGVFETDVATGRVTRANGTFCGLLGYTEAELRGLPYAALTSDAPGEGGLTRFSRKDGQTRLLELHVTALGDPAGAYTLTVAFERGAAQPEPPLRPPEPAPRYALPSAPVMVWVTDPEGVCTFLSGSWYDFTGQSPATGLGLGWLDAVHPDDRERTRTVFLAANEGQRPFGLEYRLRRRDGVYRWAVDAATPHVGDDGAFLGYIGSVVDLTERREAEAALRDSEARYRGLFESIDEGFNVIELLLGEGGAPVDYRFLEINPAFSVQTGLEPGRTLGKTVLEVIPDLEPFWIETYGRVALTGEPTRFENEAAALGRWFDVYAFRLGGPESLKVAVIFNDVTARKEAEAALAELNASLERRVAERTAELAQSEQRFAQAFSAGPTAACITSLDLTTVLEANEAFIRLTGYSRDEAVGGGRPDLWASPEDRARLERSVEAAGGANELELKLVTKSGELRDVLLSAALLRLEDHYGYLTTFDDVTERREAERWGNLLRGALDSAEEAVVVTTAELDLPGPEIVYVNAAFSKMTGYAADEVLGHTPRFLQGPESDPLVWRRMRRELEAGRSAQGEIVNYRKNGRPFVLAWNVAAVGVADGTPTHYVSAQRDVTERRALERELLDLSAREQRRVVGGLHDSVQQQLVATAMEVKRLAVVAKETDPALGAELDELYAHVQTGVRGVRAVLGELTPVQPTENGLMVALENLCRRITTLFGVPCTFSFEQPLLVRDPACAAHLFFIAQEAAVNAAKHAAAGRIDVRLTGTPERFTLSVADDGSGVNDAVLRQHRGTGMALMEGRAALLGAPLEVRSKPGRGTTVSVSLTDSGPS